MRRVLLSVFTVLLAIEGSVSVDFETTPPMTNGVLTACAGQEISLTCHHDRVDSGATIWVASSPVNCVTAVSHIGRDLSTPRPCGPFMFEEITPLPPDIPAPSILNSTAVATANVSMNGTNIECRGGNTLVNSFSVGNVSLSIIGQPPPPINLTCENITNGLNVSWETGNDINLAMGDVKYNVTVIGENDMMTIFWKIATETTAEITNTFGLLNGTRYIIIVRAKTLIGSCDGEQANITCETSESLPVITTQPSVAPTTESSLSHTSSPTPSPTALPIGAIVGIIVGIVIIFAFVIVIAIVVIFIVKKSQDGGKGSDQGIHTPLAANTEHLQLPVYAMVDKSKNIHVEQPTYQDPAKIQHETTVSGDVYAVSDKKGKSMKEVDAVYTEVDKSKKNQGLTYAAIQVDKSNSSGQQQPTGVLYSDIQHQ